MADAESLTAAAERVTKKTARAAGIKSVRFNMADFEALMPRGGRTAETYNISFRISLFDVLTPIDYEKGYDVENDEKFE
jgi:hypothetical protein